MRFCFPLFAAAAALTISHAALASDLLGSIRIEASRSRYVGACPVEVIFTGNVSLNSPHAKGASFNYYWTRSDGGKGPVNVVKPGPAQHMVIVKEPGPSAAPGGARTFR